MNILDEIIERHPDEEFLIADGFDDAVVGLCANSYRLIYSIEKSIEILQKRDGMEHMEAVEYLDFNTIRGLDYMGPNAPIFMEDIFGML